ncbi:YrhK family protein [Marinobacter sp. BGYM27]|uniref:YrhK family protein n=1 Tax=Marinobacter sp. BGYM27 TaxID=2975597 RepID=UPI0021A83A45|nr:YrhK family protein [Marinobacter sp. BGYM27]MDG5500377.1 YrhK family protein [Marinobacter sp. BGYM27]
MSAWIPEKYNGIHLIQSENDCVSNEPATADIKTTRPERSAAEQARLDRERVVHERFEWLHICNDYVSAILFLVGSVFFLWSEWQEVATWFFIVGSVFFLFAPILRTLNKRYVKKLRKGPIHW